MPRITRRQFVRGALVSAAAVYARPLVSHLAWGSLPFNPATLDPGPFHFGIASGDPAPDRVVIWTRVTPDVPGPVDVSWQVATDPSFSLGSIVRSGTYTTDAGVDYTVNVDATGLTPSSDYHYRFLALGGESRPGRTLTAPHPDATGGDLRIALTSCQDFQSGYYPTWRDIASSPVHIVMHVGDYIYEYADNGDGFRQHVPSNEILSLSDYRLRYANYRTDPNLRDAHARHPFVVVWDDHEVANNRWIDGADNHGADEGLYATRKAAAHQAFFEWVPMRRPDPADPDRIYRTLKWGKLADLVMIDTREYRNRPVGTFLSPTNVQPEISDPNRTILGAAQESWFKGELASDRASWRIVGNQVMIVHLKFGNMPDQLAVPLAQLTGMPRDGVPVNPDAWDGYQPERREILDFISRNSSNVVFLTGDIHTSWASELCVNPGNYPVEAPIAVEFVGPSITSSNLNEITMTPHRTTSIAAEVAAMANNPYIRWNELDSNGFVFISVTEDWTRGDWVLYANVKNPNEQGVFAATWRADRDSSRLKGFPV